MTATPDVAPLRPAAGAAPHRSRLRRIASHPLAHLAAALLLIALVQSFVAKVYQVPSASMEQTLMPGDRILVDRLGIAGAPERGDIVVFERPDAWRDAPRSEPSPWRAAAGWVGDLFGLGPSNGDALVKRVVGAPGDEIACCDDGGHVTVDGVALDESYVTNDLPFDADTIDCDSIPRSPRCFDPVRLGPGEFLLLGDNRADSSDSISLCRGDVPTTPACARPVDRENIVGRVFLRLWPLDRVGAP
ncbi:signal peptidase I [Microbacterium sp. cf332]|uniref:signal peptidase I n=1 Tax=Microbacterium sp. cf332 TaxID=1761804 RepID=UPI00087E2375|nr:signal peptidase I [Microbacterium sp. cf332]SDQ95774.1 signal peptidase I [Microbacterium sp. cf332]